MSKLVGVPFKYVNFNFNREIVKVPVAMIQLTAQIVLQDARVLG